MRSNVTFNSNGLKIAGHLYLPDEYKKGEKRPAIVVGHPLGGVKEQTAGLYAKLITEFTNRSIAAAADIRVSSLPVPGNNNKQKSHTKQKSRHIIKTEIYSNVK